VYLTDQGRASLDRALEVAIEHDDRVCSGLDEREREELIELLLKLQSGKVDRPGVHPAIAREHPGEP
jgi:DNA-binding MarR family transcriptional regulator